VRPSLDDVSWPVRTERLTLRRATPADAAATYAYRSDPAVAEWVTRLLPTDRSAYDEWYASADVLAKTILVEHEGEVVGDLMLDVRDGWAQLEVAADAEGVEAELGWVLSPTHRGRGFGTEAVAALLAIAFEQLGVRRVTAGCFAVNEASWKLMERVGMRREAHTLRDGLHRELGWMDGFQYGLLVEEWRALNPS
jgi:RimJ/RimL family protein N-acetyltransferase